MRLRILSELSELPQLYTFCQRQGIDNRSLLALEEAVVNIVTYSQANYINLTYKNKDDSETFVIEDDGVMFDPTAYTPCNDKAETLVAGGQGIRIMRSMMDNIQYQRVDNRNILTLVNLKNNH